MYVPKSPQNFSKIQTLRPISKGANVFHFDSFELSEKQRLLRWEDRPVGLTSKDFDVLLILVKNCPRLVTKSELMDAVWPNSYVNEANLGVHVAEVRKALRQYVANCNYIQTVPKYGYRFTGEVILSEEEMGPAELESRLVEKRFGECVRQNKDCAEAVLTLASGMRIETWRRIFGTEITLAIPQYHGQNTSHRDKISGENIKVSTLHQDGMLYITVTLEEPCG